MYYFLGSSEKMNYLCTNKNEITMNTTIINRETLNGTKWEIVFNGFYSTLYMNGKYSGHTFRSVEEAQAHLDAVDERVSAPRMVSTPLDCPSLYGRGSSVYYAD